MTTTKLPRETADALCMTISSDHVAYASNILKPSGRHSLDFFSIWLKSRLHLHPNGQKFVRVQESPLSDTTYQSLTCSCQGPTAVDIKRLLEPRLEPSPVPTHSPRPAIVAEESRDGTGPSRQEHVPCRKYNSVWPNPFYRCTCRPQKLPAIYRPMPANITHPVATHFPFTQTHQTSFSTADTHSAQTYLHSTEMNAELKVSWAPSPDIQLHLTYYFVPYRTSSLHSCKPLPSIPTVGTSPTASNQPSPLYIQ
ncbi:uncharacterized protein FFE2_08601 [Fusarium fujikuroi]|nr:uncharacterized protein FFE2_08601 [Fusarium fujikuroi]